MTPGVCDDGRTCHLMEKGTGKPTSTSWHRRWDFTHTALGFAALLPHTCTKVRDLDWLCWHNSHTPGGVAASAVTASMVNASCMMGSHTVLPSTAKHTHGATPASSRFSNAGTRGFKNPNKHTSSGNAAFAAAVRQVFRHVASSHLRGAAAANPATRCQIGAMCTGVDADADADTSAVTASGSLLLPSQPHTSLSAMQSVTRMQSPTLYATVRSDIRSAGCAGEFMSTYHVTPLAVPKLTLGHGTREKHCCVGGDASGGRNCASCNG